MSKEIPLTLGLVTVIDDEDWLLVGKFNWHAHSSVPGRFYACRKAPRRERRGGPHLLKMHRVLTGAIKGQDVDHINGDTLDNRRANLRLASRSQNMANARVRSDNRSGFKGVFWRRDTSKWCAQIQVLGRGIHLGLFTAARDAACAYDEAAIKHFGVFACTNQSLGLLGPEGH